MNANAKLTPLTIDSWQFQLVNKGGKRHRKFSLSRSLSLGVNEPQLMFVMASSHSLNGTGNGTGTNIIPTFFTLTVGMEMGLGTGRIDSRTVYLHGDQERCKI